MGESKFVWEEGDIQIIHQSKPEKRGQKGAPCPTSVHFHVFATDVFEKEDFSMVFECETPNEALERFMKWLPHEWEGSIEVDSDKTNSLRKDPLIDFWKTPLQK